jgi:hypothetical protein
MKAGQISIESSGEHDVYLEVKWYIAIFTWSI